MTDLIKQLNTQFCLELNKAWLDASLKFDGKNLEMEFFTEVHHLIEEAKEQGYLFNLEYCPNNFVAERINGKALEPELCNMPEWEQLNLVINMLQQCETNNWSNIKKHFEELKRQRTKPILLKYAIECAKKDGPFYAGDKNDTINIFGTCGSVPLEMMLIAFIFNKSAALNK